MSKSVLQVLTEARALIDSPEKWCKQFLRLGEARCLTGAVAKAAGGELTCLAACGVVTSCVPPPFGMTKFNDHPDTTHADVMRVLDCAIEKARGQGI